MPADAHKTHCDILESAKAEFLAHGFAGASLRTIAEGARVTTGALYRHFADKEALFEALVAPAYTGLLDGFQEMTDEYIKLLETGGLEAMWQRNSSSVLWYVDYLYDHYEAFRLLLSASEQTVYENFTHTLINLDMELTLCYFDAARRRGHAVNQLDRQELHMLIGGQFTAIFELILHDVPRENALRYAATAVRFTQAGWKDLLIPK